MSDMRKYIDLSSLLNESLEEPILDTDEEQVDEAGLFGLPDKYEFLNMLGDKFFGIDQTATTRYSKSQAAQMEALKAAYDEGMKAGKKLAELEAKSKLSSTFTPPMSTDMGREL